MVISRSKVWCLFAIWIITLFLPHIPLAKEPSVFPENSWDWYNTPEQAGWSSEKLKEAQLYFESLGSAALVFVHDGKILISWGDTQYKFRTHSIRKSYLNTLYGIHVQEGRVDLEKTLASLGIDDLSPLTELEKKARIVDLLKSRSGVYHPAAFETSSMKNSRPMRGSHNPGTYWYYNNWDFNVLGTIFEQETGAKIFQDFYKRIALPLQMEHFQVTDCYFHLDRQLSLHPAFAIRMSSLDMARYGLLYLSEGKWRNRQIVPQGWIKLETDSYSTDWLGYGVGFKWTRVTYGILSDLGAYYSEGYRGHWIFIIPKINAVFIHRVNTERPHGRVKQKQVETLLQGIIAANSSLEIPKPDLSDPYRSANLISENVEISEPASLPQKIEYIKISSDVPPLLSALLGKWEGKWGKVLPSFLIIDNVSLESVSCVFGWGSYAPWKISKWSNTFQTKIEMSDGRPKIELHDNDKKFTFYLSQDLQTIEGYYRSTYIQMKKTGAPVYH